MSNMRGALMVIELYNVVIILYVKSVTCYRNGS